MIRRTLLCTAAAAALLLAMGPARAADVVIGSSAVGGSYNLYAGGLASYLTERNPNVQATARTTRGSVENVRLLDRAALDFGFANGTVVAQQRAGTGQFEDATSDRIRGIAVIDLSPSHWVSLARHQITSMEDLRGKRVSIGAAGSGGANTAMMMLTAAGIADDVRIQNLGFSESATNLRDGNLEAFAGGSALPMPAVVDLSTSHDITLISFPLDYLERLQANEPAMEITVIPAGTYRGVDDPITTVGNPSMLLTHADMPDDVVYEIAKTLTLEDNKAYMRAIYSAWDPNPGVAAWERIGVPLHPGAERAYREAGLID